MAYLILVRHGKSEYNKQGLWCGHTDIDLVEEGIEEARAAGKALADIDIHSVHVSALRRAQQTFHELKVGHGNLSAVDAKVDAALNERHYGIHTGKNKWQVKEEVGEEEFQKIRRGWDVKIPEGETLKDVYDRAVPYFQTHILPEIIAGQNVLIVAHGNTLRALIKYLENVSEELIEEVEVGTGEVHCYNINAEGNVESKEVRAINEQRGRV